VEALDELGQQLAAVSSQLTALVDMVRLKADGAEVDLLKVQVRQMGAAREQFNADLLSKASSTKVHELERQLQAQAAALATKADSAKLRAIDLELEALRADSKEIGAGKAEIVEVSRLSKRINHISEAMRTKAEISDVVDWKKDLSQIASAIDSKAAAASLAELDVMLRQRTAECMHEAQEVRVKIEAVAAEKGQASEVQQLFVRCDDIERTILPTAKAQHIEERLTALMDALREKLDRTAFDDAYNKLFAYYEALSGFVTDRRCFYEQPEVALPPGRPRSTKKHVFRSTSSSRYQPDSRTR